MAFTAATFIPTSSMANSSAGRMFSYTTADTLATAKGAAYFNVAAATNGLRDGDLITVNAAGVYSILAMAVSAVGAATTDAALDFV